MLPQPLSVSEVVHGPQKTSDSVSTVVRLMQPWKRLRLHEGHYHVAFGDGLAFSHTWIKSLAVSLVEIVPSILGNFSPSEPELNF